jgi:hypothetical protein
LESGADYNHEFQHLLDLKPKKSFLLLDLMKLLRKRLPTYAIPDAGGYTQLLFLHLAM